MNNKQMISIAIIAVAVIIISLAGIYLSAPNMRQSGASDADVYGDVDGDVATDFSDYSVIKSMVQKLDVKSGRITDAQGKGYMITTDYRVELYKDTIIAYTPDGTNYMIFNISDIRLVVIYS